MAAVEQPQDLLLTLYHKTFLLKTKDVSGLDKTKLQAEVLETIHQHDLAPVYVHIANELGWSVDKAKLEEMKQKNAAKLTELDAKVKDAEENLGETEVRDALHAKADYLASIGDKEAAVEAYAAAEAKTAGSGNKMDLVFSQIRLFMTLDDWQGVKKLLARVQVLCDNGGDWERKNKLKVYQALFAMYSRDLKQAALLLQEAIATFTATELFSYTNLISYAVITSVVSLDRVTLKAKVVDSPEVRTAIDQVPHLPEFLSALYECRYKEFFKAFAEVITLVKCDPYLATHVRYFVREVRVRAYSQFLESYKSVTLASMASAFDVSTDFMDEEVADLIVAGRLNAKIDRVAGVIETNRPDERSALYMESLKKGDLLLNRIQKLSKVIDME